MSLYNIRPENTPYFDSQRVSFGNWQLQDDDFVYGDGTVSHYRYIWHYDTIMGYYFRAHDGLSWSFGCGSIGHGSVSDQNGMNRLMRGYGWRYLRSGGYARYEWVGR